MPENKSKKKVLMICYEFPPCSGVGALRSGKFAKYLGQYGWHCEVLTGQSGNAKEYEGKPVKIHTMFRISLGVGLEKIVAAFYVCRDFLKTHIRILNQKKRPGKDLPARRNLQSVGGLGIASYIARWLLLPDAEALWILPALPKALCLARQCSLIYTSLHPFSAHVLGLIIKKLTHKTWVADYRDEWSLNPTWDPPTRFHRWLGKTLDKACVKNADIVINTTEVRTQMFIKHFGGPTEKFITIQNGYDEDDIAKFQEIAPQSSPLVMTSLGSLYGGRDAKPFVRAVAYLVNNNIIAKNELNIKIIGGLNPDLIREVENLEIGDVVQIVPRIPQAQAFMALAQSHVAILFGSEMEKVAMTTKVYEYAAMGKAILGLVPEGPVYDFVSKCGGWCVDGTDEKKILKVVTNIFERYKSGKLEAHHVPDFVKRYERRALTKKLAHHFDKCMK